MDRQLPLIILVLFGLIFNSAKSQTSPPDTKKSHTNIILKNASDIGTLRSLLVQQKGKLLIEKYFDGASANYPYNIKSASKSIISILAGIAVDKGLISLDETLGDYFSSYFKQQPDSAKANITIRNLLSMQAGLETASFYNYGRWIISKNWVEWNLKQNLVEEPGGKMLYSTGVSHLLSVIITKASGMSTRQFAMKYLFNPLNIRPGGWDKDPQGYYMGGNNLALKPTDLLKIGQMMLQKGIYNDNRIVSEDWVTDSFKSYTHSNFNPYDYGYMWWNKIIDREKVYFAWGFGGQYIFIIPSLKSVIVITSSLAKSDSDRSYKNKVFNLIGDHVIPMLRVQRNNS